MNPWLMLWSPHLHLPLSGNVAQHIDPDTNWFFAGIAPTAGDSAIERKAFDIATYGRQLGLINEILLDIAASHPPTTEQGRASLERLQTIQTQIDALKTQDATDLMQSITDLVQQLKSRHEDKLPALREQLREIVG
jgi:hypothetical protein